MVDLKRVPVYPETRIACDVCEMPLGFTYGEAVGHPVVCNLCTDAQRACSHGRAAHDAPFCRTCLAIFVWGLRPDDLMKMVTPGDAR